MPRVTLKHKNEHFEGLMRRFKKAVEKADVLQDYRDHEFYEKPSVTRKRQKAAARKRAQRQSLEARTPVWVEPEE
jgi:small subunit ribosomal protein S21